MPRWNEAKIRSEETWAEVRRAWEGGETAASAARRYDVGLANLWRRRAAEGWDRERFRPADPTPEPVEGWDRYAARKLTEWEAQLEATRALALDLLNALESGPMTGSVWHLGWLYRMRAERLGPEAAEDDRKAAEGKPWRDLFWAPDGTLWRQGRLDDASLTLWREDWRRQAGLPEGVAERVP